MMTLDGAIKHAKEVAEKNEEDFRLCPSQECDGTQDCRCLKNGEGKGCIKCAAEYRQLAEWLKILKSAKFEYNEAWLTITHPTPDVTYADKQRAQVILDKFRNSLGAISALQIQDVNDKNTEDTISRRNVIDELKRYFHDEYYQRTSIQDCINCFIEDILTKLPSAQSEPSTEIQEILNYLDTTLHPIVSPYNWYVYSELYDMVSRLPSTQLEIIACADCKHWICHDRRCGFWNHGVKPLDWCCYAERREE